MFGNSSPILSNQGTAPHRRLHAVVTRHFQQPFLKSVSAYSRTAFDSSLAAWNTAGKLPLILDAGCGTDLSTKLLASRFPDYFVISIDQSTRRLGRFSAREGALPENAICIRADLTDCWRLLQAAGITVARQYLLYPNPWPKAAHVRRRRWHAHPVFPALVALGGVFECRSNEPVYIEECASTLPQLGATAVECERYAPSEPITPFESRYLASRHELWRCTAQLSAPVTAEVV